MAPFTLLLLLALPHAISAAPTCPPAGWVDQCKSVVWPPAPNAYCCSQYGNLGVSTAHCTGGSSMSALTECCTMDADNSLTCHVDCDPPPADCTGVPAIDAILANSDVGCKIGLSKANTLYTWKGFCDAVKQLNSIEGTTRRLFLGDGTDAGAAQGLTNIAGLLAQSMWESGGDAPFSACDENNYRHTDTAACTQRSDGARYDSLTDKPWACPVDKNMVMTAETAASWATKGPMQCAPGTVTEGCCWWGRGAIQTTGPNNYGLLNQEVIKKVPALVARNVDICANPEAICQNQETKWLGAMFYWANNVQGFCAPDYKGRFDNSLHGYVSGGLSLAASKVDGFDFATGTGGVVNNGYWGQGHEYVKRNKYFDKIIKAFKDAGMSATGGPGAGIPTASGSLDDDCSGKKAPPTTGGTDPSPPTTGGGSTPDPSPPVTGTKSCPPAGWERCKDGAGAVRWPPPADGYCCSTAGWLGISPAHCTGGGIDSRDACCTLTADGTLTCGEEHPHPTANPELPESPEAPATPPTSSAPPTPPTPHPTEPEPPSGTCGKAWDQCGGKGWGGATCCEGSSWQCEYKDAWYSQCRPFSGPNPSSCGLHDGPPGAPVCGPTCNMPCTEDFAAKADCEANGGTWVHGTAGVETAEGVPFKAATQGRCEEKKTTCTQTWKKCGGKGWTGPTCCESGSRCVVGNPWYHQCQPSPSVATATEYAVAEQKLQASPLVAAAKVLYEEAHETDEEDINVVAVSAGTNKNKDSETKDGEPPVDGVILMVVGVCVVAGAAIMVAVLVVVTRMRRKSSASNMPDQNDKTVVSIEIVDLEAQHQLPATQ